VNQSANIYMEHNYILTQKRNISRWWMSPLHWLVFSNYSYCFWTLSIVLFLFKTTQRFGDWILFPSSVETYSVWPDRHS
jgi:hypothetical protein